MSLFTSLRRTKTEIWLQQKKCSKHRRETILDKLGYEDTFMCPTLEGRNEFVLHGVLANFKQKLNMVHEKLVDAMKINPSLSHVKSYNAIDKDIIKCEVNRNDEGFSNYVDDDVPQDVIKGINETLEYKPLVALEEEEEDYTPAKVSKQKTLANKNIGELKDDGLNRNEDVKIKEIQKDGDNSMNNENNIDTPQK